MQALRSTINRRHVRIDRILPMRLRDQLRYSIKLLGAGGLYYSGLLHFYLRWRARNCGVVLLYHRVLTEAERAATFSSTAIIVSPTTFERQLRFLRRHFTVVGPEEFHDWLSGKHRYQRPPCLITFDDGWQDNLDHAHPRLKAEGMPALIFLPTAYIGSGKSFWQERLSRLLYRLGQQPLLQEHPLVARYNWEDLFSAQGAELIERAGNLARTFKIRSLQEVDTIITEVSAALAAFPKKDEHADVDIFLSWEAVREMRTNGIHFGSHTVTHPILTQVDAATVKTELHESRRTLEQRLQTPVRLLAYPNGNHDAQTCQQAREAGYDLAFTTVPGWVQPGDDPMRIRRHNIHEGAHRHLPLFFATLLNVF